MASMGGAIVQGTSGFLSMIFLLVILGLFPLLPVFTYSYKKKFFNPRIWKIYFIIVLLPTVLFSLFVWFFPSPYRSTMIEKYPFYVLLPIPYILVLLPGYYSVYKLAFKK